MAMKILILLYSCVGIAEMIGYMPQLVRLWRNTSPSREISLAAFTLWTLTSVISACYAFFLVKNLLIFSVSCVHVTGCGLILLLTVYNRYVRHAPKNEDTQAKINGTPPKGGKGQSRPILQGKIILPHEAQDVSLTPKYMQKIDDFALDTETIN